MRRKARIYRKLRELGLVDITTTGWEPSEEDRQLLLDIEGHAKRSNSCATSATEEGRCKAGAEPFATGAEAYEHYAAAHQQATALHAEIGRLEKTADELRPWGEFSPERTRSLAEQGIVLRYFFTPKSNYDKFEASGRSAIPSRRSTAPNRRSISSSWRLPARR